MNKIHILLTPRNVSKILLLRFKFYGLFSLFCLFLFLSPFYFSLNYLLECKIRNHSFRFEMLTGKRRSETLCKPLLNCTLFIGISIECYNRLSEDLRSDWTLQIFEFFLINQLLIKYEFLLFNWLSVFK